MNNNLGIGKRLKKLRLSIKKTLDEESKIFNVSLNTVYRWEHDLCIPRKSVLMKIAAFYNVSYEWILNGNTGENTKEVCAKCKDYIPDNENIEKSTDQIILNMIKKLSVRNKYKIIGYIELMCLENNEYPDSTDGAE